MRYGCRLLLMFALAGLGCASKRQATQPIAPPSTGDNVVISTMQGAGRTIVEGTKKGYRSAKSGVQKLFDPASVDSVSTTDSSRNGTGPDRKGTGGKTVVHGHQSDDSATRTAQADDSDAVPDRKGTGAKTVVRDHQSDNDSTRLARADDGDPFAEDSRSTSSRNAETSARVRTRKVGTNVTDTFVIE